MENQNNPVKSSQSESNRASQKGNTFLIIAIIVGVIAIGIVAFALGKYSNDIATNNFELEEEKYQPSYLPEQEKTIPQMEEQEEIKKEEIIPSKKSDEMANWKTYRNNEYGFSLNFPLLWKEYKTSKRMLNWGAFGTSDSIDFGLPAQNSLFNISMHTKSQWKNIISEEGPRPTYIKENGKFVFAYAIAQDAVNNEMVERIKEIKSILSTFKFTE